MYLQFYDMASDGSVHPNRPGCQSGFPDGWLPHASLLDWVGTIRGTVHDRLTIEIRRGCTRGCRFCQPGMLRPARDVEPKQEVLSRECGQLGTMSFPFYPLAVQIICLSRLWDGNQNRLENENISLPYPVNG